MMGRLAEYFWRWPWMWSVAGALLVWIATVVIAGRGFIGTIQAALQIAALLVMVGVGQLFVITAGNGNIDLSMPNTMTLAALIAVSSMQGHSSLGGAILLGLLVGLIISVANIVAIFVLGVPPIVATLGVGLLAQSAVLLKAANYTAVVRPSLSRFVASRFAGLPTLALLALGVTVLGALVLHRTTFGRRLRAIGQSRGAAESSGITVNAVIAVSYIISAVLASLAGILLSAVSGTSITLGDPYLLTSIAVVVLGGSLITGGHSNLTGVWGAALFLNLIITLFYVLHLSVAVQDIFEGVMIIAVLSMSGKPRAGRASRGTG